MFHEKDFAVIAQETIFVITAAFITDGVVLLVVPLVLMVSLLVWVLRRRSSRLRQWSISYQVKILVKLGGSG